MAQKLGMILVFRKGVDRLRIEAVRSVFNELLDEEYTSQVESFEDGEGRRPIWFISKRRKVKADV